MGQEKVFLTYLLEILNDFSELIIVDPKQDSPARWAIKKEVDVEYPEKNRSKSDYVSRIIERLSELVKTMSERQARLFINPKSEFPHITMVIDETLALTEGLNKTVKDSFLGLLSTIALLGRSSNDFTESEDLVRYARQNNSMFLFLIIDKTYFFSKFLDSRHHNPQFKKQREIKSPDGNQDS